MKIMIRVFVFTCLAAIGLYGWVATSAGQSLNTRPPSAEGKVDKAELLRKQIERHLEEGRRNPIPKDQVPPITEVDSALLDLSPRITGFLEAGDIQYPFISVKNGWSGYFDDVLIHIYAGSLKHDIDPDQGAIVVRIGNGNPYAVTMDQEGFQWETHHTPTKDGAVRVTKVEETQVTLSTKSGKQFVFDLATRQFR